MSPSRTSPKTTPTAVSPRVQGMLATCTHPDPHFCARCGQKGALRRLLFKNWLYPAHTRKFKSRHIHPFEHFRPQLQKGSQHREGWQPPGSAVPNDAIMTGLRARASQRLLYPVLALLFCVLPDSGLCATSVIPGTLAYPDVAKMGTAFHTKEYWDRFHRKQGDEPFEWSTPCPCGARSTLRPSPQGGGGGGQRRAGRLAMHRH